MKRKKRKKSLKKKEKFEKENEKKTEKKRKRKTFESILLNCTLSNHERPFHYWKSIILIPGDFTQETL